ncbi:hypothetical protein ACSLOE_30800, partial [Escherichia coli]
MLKIHESSHKTPHIFFYILKLHYIYYLLGRERNREGATVLQGNPEEVRELIDATPFAKKYTSGVLS